MSEPQDRRSLLRWAVHGLGAIFAVILGFPIVSYLIDGRHRRATAAGFRPVEGFRKNDLVLSNPPVPVQGFIRAVRRDAWTLSMDILGRVWVIKHGRGDNDLHVFTTICPHLGCFVNFTGTDFLCPCHGAKFNRDGQKIGEGNVAPRPMDSLAFRWDDKEPDNPVLLVEYLNFQQLKPTPVVKT